MRYIFPNTFLFIVVFSILLLPAQLKAGLLLGKDDRVHTTAQKETVASPWVMSYYVGYQNGYLKPRDIDYTLMTHIVVGGVGVQADGTLREHWHMENGNGRNVANEIGQRADRAGVKQLIWLGGPNEEDLFKSATEDTHRATFVANILALVDTLGYDGVDIDWEPIREEDEPGILALVRDLRTARPSLLITVPINWVSGTGVQMARPFYTALASSTDRLFVMSYSMAGPWPGWKSWHGGALFGETASMPGSVSASVAAYRNAGVPEEKLGIGIGTYATCWEYPVTKPRATLPSTFSSADLHTMSMRTMFEEYYTKRYEKWDSTAAVPYLSFKKARGDFRCGFVSYENERSVARKAQFVQEEGLGGVLMWNIGTDYRPDVLRRSERHPLLMAVRGALPKRVH